MQTANFDERADEIVALIGQTALAGDSKALARAMAQLRELSVSHLAETRSRIERTLLDGDLDGAEETIEQLRKLNPISPHISSATALLLIGRGRVADALQLLNDAEDDHPHVLAMCLYLLGDPTWEGLALAHENDNNMHIGAAMRSLLGRAGVKLVDEVPIDSTERIIIPPTFARV